MSIIVLIASCRNKSNHVEHLNTKPADSSITTLVQAVNRQIVADVPVITAQSGLKIFSTSFQGIVTYDERQHENIASRVDGRIEKMYIKYNYQPVSKGQVILEIYSPSLAAAQRELLFLQKSGDTQLIQKSRQKLLLLGMTESQVNNILRRNEILYNVPVYSPVSGFVVEQKIGIENSFSASETNYGMGMNDDENASAVPSQTVSNTPFSILEGQYVNAGKSLFTVYRNNGLVAELSIPSALNSFVIKGQKILLSTTGNNADVSIEYIGLVQPSYNSLQNFMEAKVYLSGKKYVIGQLVTAQVAVASRGWWLPSSAVYSLGESKIVFKKENNVFIPVKVETSFSLEGQTLITQSLEGWHVAQNASFLVDSESFIKIDSISNNLQ